jgi:hypothetical protein
MANKDQFVWYSAKVDRLDHAKLKTLAHETKQMKQQSGMGI